MPTQFDVFSGRPLTIGTPLIYFSAAPTASDSAYAPGTIALVQSTMTSYQLLDVTGSVATWAPLINPGGAVTDIATDSGTATPAAGVITIHGGIGCATSASGSTVTIDVSGGFDWATVAGASQTLVASNGYITGNAGLTTFTLPAVASIGDTFQIAGASAGGWIVAQNAGQVIHYNAVDTTVGAGGSIASTNRYNIIEILCVVANTGFTVLSSSGALTVV